jgi:PAS domain S-box-containing protein
MHDSGVGERTEPTVTSADTARIPGSARVERSSSPAAQGTFLAPSIGVKLAVVFAIVGLMAAVRLGLFWHRVMPIAFGVPLVVFVWLRDRRLLWLTVATFAGVTILKYALFTPISEGSDTAIAPLERFVDVSLVLVDLLVISLVVDLVIRHADKLERRHAELAESNDELAAREEEIARQNEELQSQTEELERQTEELRVTNEELARREKMLESLLSLSRALAAEVTAAETMNKVCQALGELVNGPGTATAIVERKGENMQILCHQGFGPDGPVRESWPLRSSFEALVLERNRTGFLENADLRPDLTLPQPRSGPPVRSVLAAPLRVGGTSVGALEVYHAEPHAWSDEQINLIESLAAQASISLEASRLFEDVDNERQRLLAVLRTIPIAVKIANADGSDIRLNPAGAILYGVAPDVPLDAADLRARMKVYRNGQLLQPEAYAINRALRGIEVAGEEIEIVFSSGRRLTLLFSAAPIRDRSGKITGAVAAFADIAEQKRMQLELDTRRRQAEEESVRKTRFLAAVSHDIRTPANAISLLAELLQRTSTSPGLIDEVPEIARDLKSSSLSLVNLVSDVLDLTRFDSGKVDLNEAEVALANVMTDEYRQFQQAAKDKRLAFHCEPPAGRLIVRTDRVKLSRILGNLIANAIKFTEAGSVTVDGARLPDGRVQIRVIDTGSGIPPEHQDRIFDEYYQLKNPGRDRNAGTGLGLAISRRLIQAMGGDISLTSTPGRGSTFVVTLPATCVVPA